MVSALWQAIYAWVLQHSTGEQTSSKVFAVEEAVADIADRAIAKSGGHGKVCRYCIGRGCLRCERRGVVG